MYAEIRRFLYVPDRKASFSVDEKETRKLLKDSVGDVVNISCSSPRKALSRSECSVSSRMYVLTESVSARFFADSEFPKPFIRSSNTLRSIRKLEANPL